MYWYEIDGVSAVDTPALIVYRDRIVENIRRMIKIAGSPEKLMPHVKTHKMVEVVKLQIDAGITRFKCATISEAEMIGMSGASGALIAYQPVGPKAKRILNLVNKYPNTEFSVIVDDFKVAEQVSQIFEEAGSKINVYIDINVGMNRTGIPAGKEAFGLYKLCSRLKGLKFKGLHAYDGHITESALPIRVQKCKMEFIEVYPLKEQIEKHEGRDIELVAGGTPTFPIHAREGKTICSPGTPLLWDFGYGDKYSDLDFLHSALVITRIRSKIKENFLCLDLGYKAIAAENPLPRVRFLNALHAKQLTQSEEHLVIGVSNNSHYNTGDLLYGIPLHICPTCALYQEAKVVDNSRLVGTWEVTARDRFISV